jgi:hypothetical protein
MTILPRIKPCLILLRLSPKGAGVYVEVRGTHAQVGDPDNCQALDVRVAAADRSHLDAALRAAGLGRWDGGAEADLDVTGLRAHACRGPIGADWAQRWDGMVRYADSKGWLSADGEYLRAHLLDVD